MSTWIGIPFLSAFLFVMGGILGRDLLWYFANRSVICRPSSEAESE